MKHSIEHALGLAVAIPEDRDNYGIRRELIRELTTLWKQHEERDTLAATVAAANQAHTAAIHAGDNQAAALARRTQAAAENMYAAHRNQAELNTYLAASA